MIKLTIHKSSELDRNVKATIQSTGKLGFSEGAKKKLCLDKGGYLVIATNEEDDKDENLYAWIENDANGGGFKINKAGEYYNVNTKSLFDKLKIDYRNRELLVIYDIIEMENEGKLIYKFIKRVQRRVQKNKTDIADS